MEISKLDEAQRIGVSTDSDCYFGLTFKTWRFLVFGGTNCGCTSDAYTGQIIHSFFDCGLMATNGTTDGVL
ncbi:MAG: hypothetical protein R2788_04500 [Saprospiraceae bacterium]